MLESPVKAYLHQRVREEGGISRNAAWVGRMHCPDVWLTLPWVAAWVETKRPGKTARAGQAREHTRMRKHGVIVVVLDTKEKIDKWIEKTKRLYAQP